MPSPDKEATGFKREGSLYEIRNGWAYVTPSFVQICDSPAVRKLELVIHIDPGATNHTLNGLKDFSTVS